MDLIDQAIERGEHPLTLAHLSMIDVPHAELARATAGAGFDGVGLRIVPAKGTSLAKDLLGNPPAIVELKAVLRDTGIGVMDAESFALREEIDAAQAYGPALDLLADLGGRVALASVADPDRRRALDAFAALVERGQKAGVTVGLEFISFRDVRTLGDAQAFLRDADVAGSGVILDALHFFRTGGRPEEIAALPPCSLLYAQICDAVADGPADNEGLLVEARTGRLIPGHGETRLADLVRYLPRALPISIEAPVAALAGLSAAERASILARETRHWLEGLAQGASRA